MKRGYVAGPVGANDIGRLPRIRAAISVGEQMAALGVSPFIPHLFHWWDEQHPHDYEYWMQHCFAWLEQCHFLYRMDGASPGADREAAWMRENNRPVFVSFEELTEWARR
jgi:hypothetical protein